MTEIQSLGRGLRILDFLGQSYDGASITELADLLGVDKGTASRLVSTLVSHGYAEKDDTTRRFHLASQVVSLSRSVLTRLPLREAAKSFLRELMECTGECAHLAVLSQGKALYIDQVESPVTLRVNAQIGTMNPLHCTALGKTLLAFCEADFPTNLERYTPRTITDPEELLSHIEKVKVLGYALDDQEFDLDVRCISAPVFDFRGKGIGSIGISGPATRVTTERVPALARIVMEVAKGLSSRMLQNL
jgi:IclR family transcriptional regulator, KDG regulon repressor